MPRSYSMNFTGTNSTEGGTDSKPLQHLNAGANTVAARIYDLVFGSDAVADNASRFRIVRSTTTGSNAASIISSFPIAAQDGTAAGQMITLAGIYGTTQPTLTAGSSVLSWAQNQRATFRWVAAPGKELVTGVAAQAGLALLCSSNTSTYSSVSSIEYEE